MKLISVIMSTYNEKKEYLSQSIESILGQSYNKLEIIIVIDNPKNDDLVSTVNYYAQIDDRVKVIKNDKNLGLTTSLNKALQYANGEYIARMDADDVNDFKRFEKEVEYLEKNNLDIVGCETRRIDEENNIVISHANISYSPVCIMKCLLFDNCVAHPTWLVRRDVYQHLKGYRNINLCEDYDFLLRARKNSYNIGICDEILFNYRINTKGISRSNGLRQMLTARYLQKMYNNLNSVRQEDIDHYLDRKVKETSKLRYEKALKKANTGQELIKQGKYYGVGYFIHAAFISKYVLGNFYRMVRMHILRKLY